MKRPARIIPADSKLGVLLPGLGAVATTTIAGVMLARKGLGKPIGSLTQMGTLRLGKRSENRSPYLRDAVPLASLDQLVFGGWDIFPDTAFESAQHAEVLESKHLDPIRSELEAIRPMPAVFYPEYVRRLSGPNVKSAPTKADMVEAVREDIRNFRKTNGVSRAVAVWCGSTEVYMKPADVHMTVASFEDGLRRNDPGISNSQIYGWACIKEGVPFANGSPGLTVDFPAALALAADHNVALAGKDFKTGQTLMKTILAPGMKSRLLGLRGWYSTNILGNRDGEVLDDAESFRSKEVSKLGVLESILEPARNPELYGNFSHKVRIDYYPPRGDQKEGWDNIDIFGWLGYPMQIKVNFLCRDSILAAPLVLDLALLMDFAQRSGLSGVQEWLGFYFKSPMTDGSHAPDHDLFLQLRHLKNTLRWALGEDVMHETASDHYE